MTALRILKKDDLFLSGDVPMYAESFPGKKIQLLTPHGHECSELTLITSGKAVHCAGGNLCPVRKNDVLLVHPGTVHSFEEPSPDFSGIAVFYDSRIPYIPLMATGLPIISVIYPVSPHQKDLEKPVVQIAEEDSEALTLLLQKIHYEVKYQRIGYKLLAFCQFSEFIMYANRNHSFIRDFSVHEGLARAIEYVNSRFAEKLAIPQLSRMAGMSVRAFYQYFMKVHGTSPYEYILKLRLHHVYELLKNPYLPIEQIAVQTGFSSGNHMSRLFRQHYGMTPKQYQLQLRKQK